jgi:hypothetical protein
MRDATANLNSASFHNFSGYDFNKGGAYDVFMNGALDNPNRIFPNLRDKIMDIRSFGKENYNMSDFEYLWNSGKNIGAHAEVRALDDLAKKRFPDYMTNLPSSQVFDAWLKNDVLGYNRNIQFGIGQQNFIMHTCVECYYITFGVTFIKPL